MTAQWDEAREAAFQAWYAKVPLATNTKAGLAYDGFGAGWAAAVAAERQQSAQFAESLKFTLYRPAKDGPGGGQQALDVVPLSELLAALRQEGGST